MALPSFGTVTHAVGHEPMPFETCLAKIATTGAEHIALLPAATGPVIRRGVPSEAQFPNVLASAPDDLLAVVEKAGLRISVLFATPRTDVSSAAAEASTLATFQQYRDYAARLGCQALGISSPAVAGPGLPVTEKADQLRRLATLMNDLAMGAPGGRLSIAVDIHYNSLVESVADALFLVKAMPETRAGLILNVGHLTTAHQEGWRLLEEVPDRVHVIGWKDHSLAPDRPFPMYSVELGTGDTPFERYLGALRGTDALRPVHLVNVEHAPKGEEVRALQRSIAHLRDLWTQVL